MPELVARLFCSSIHTFIVPFLLLLAESRMFFFLVAIFYTLLMQFALAGPIHR